MNMSWINRLRRADQQRAGFPGEHWLALTAGLWFLRRKGGSFPIRLATKAAGAALLYRAASGRDGVGRWWPGGGSRRPAPQARLGAGTRATGEPSGDDLMGGDQRYSAAGGTNGFPERGAGSSYEPRSNPAVKGFRDFR